MTASTWITVTLPISFTSTSTYIVQGIYSSSANVNNTCANCNNSTASEFKAYTTGGNYGFIAIGY